MLQNITRKILYSNLITDLIKTNKVLAIYLGGSKIYGLDSPESNYDIIIITKDYCLLNYNYTTLTIEDYQIDISIQPIEELMNVLKEPFEFSDLQTLKNFLDITYMNNKNLLYKSKYFNNFLNYIQEHNEAIVTLLLYKLKNHLRFLIQPPVYTYTKELYHYLLVIYLLENLKLSHELHLTSKQKEILKSFKISTQIPDVFYEILSKNTNYTQLISTYDYTKLYKEVKLYE